MVNCIGWPQVKALLGPYLVLLASTVNGYEGTGRSLSLKLLQQLRSQAARSSGGSKDASSGSTVSLGSFREASLIEPIRCDAKDDEMDYYHTLKPQRLALCIGDAYLVMMWVDM